MKAVDVCHKWAHNYGPSDSFSCGNLFSEGNTIYSYGRHFPMAKRIDSKTVLFTTNTYSNTTAKHLSWTFGAIPGACTIFNVADVNADSQESHLKNVVAMLESVFDLAKKQKKARSYDYSGGISETLANAAKYAERFEVDLSGLQDWARKMMDTTDVDALLGLSVDRKNAIQAENEARERRELAQKEANLALWRTNDYNGWQLPNTAITYLRIAANGDIETSRHITIEAKQAKALWKKVSSLKSKGKEWVTNGHKIEIAGYNLNKITADGDIIAGCHHIPYSESEAIAKALNWA